jgi:hypothetical protein
VTMETEFGGTGADDRAKNDLSKRDDRIIATPAWSNDEVTLFALTSAALAIILSNPTEGFSATEPRLIGAHERVHVR